MKKIPENKILYPGRPEGPFFSRGTNIIFEPNSYILITPGQHAEPEHGILITP